VPAPLVQLTRRGIVTAPDATLAAASSRFNGERHLLLPQFLASDLLGAIQARLARARFKLRIAHDVRPPAVDAKLDDPTLQGSLRWMLSDPRLFRAIERLTDATAVGSFNGGVYRLAQELGHHDSWHDDADGYRVIGITVNLSDAPFEGGELQMRETATHRLLWRYANTGAGDALLFAIDRSLEHCIAPMKGAATKTALAGWFCSAGQRG
jgi:hypothetical protein